MDAPRFAPGNVVGTPLCMSPEAARGERVDGRSDLFSLGSTAYCLVAGRPPFDGGSIRELFHKLVQGQAPTLREIIPAVPPELSAWWPS